MKKKVAIIGLGHFGSSLSLHLMERGVEVLALDNVEEKVEALRDRVSHAMLVDSRDPVALKNLGLHDMDSVVVAIGEDFESSILTTAHLQELGIKRIINRVVSPVHEKLLRLMKVADLVLPENDAAYQLANRMTKSGVHDTLELTKGYSIVEVDVPKFLIGKTLEEADLRRKYKLNLVTVARERARPVSLSQGLRPELDVLGIPPADYVFSEEDLLVVFGKEKDIENFANASDRA